MKLYWSLKSIPELADLPKEKRMEVWRACHPKDIKHWQTWISFGFLGICVFLGMAFGKFYIRIIGQTIGGIIALWIWFIIFWQIKVSVVRPHIREYLNSHG
jgi:hypothetical protein